ncbi:MAG: HRDC domain-containing protein [Myxococcota bacterium]|nr:HRDC domain-containing protein [Myxococcota bacterium]
MASFPQTATDILTSEQAQTAAQRLSSSGELAIDVEADAMHAFHARLCFVQVGTDEDIFLFDTLSPGVDAGLLAPLCADPTRTKYFHAAGGDLQFLAEAGVRVQGLFDTHRAATLLGWPKVGLADLVRDEFQLELAKEHQQADFSIRPVPTEMRAYIADDVRYLVHIGRKVRAACLAADILEEVLLDCQRMSDDAAARPDQAGAFRPKLPKNQLSPNQFALAHATTLILHRKRLEWAEAENIPMGRMLSNAAIHAIALKPPGNARELVKLEGVRGAFVREHGDEVLALLKDLIVKSRAGELAPPEEKPGDRDPTRKKREDALKVFRSAKATERKVTQSVILTNPLVDELSRRPPASMEALAAIPYFGEKRVRLYGAALLDLLGKV